MDTRPLGILVQPHLVPDLPSLLATPSVVERIRETPDAQRCGVMVVVPRPASTTILAQAADSWPPELAKLGVRGVALILGVDSWLLSLVAHDDLARPFRAAGIAFAAMHEGHLATDEIIAWFERRPPRYPFGFAELERLRESLRLRGDAMGLWHLELLADHLRDNQTTATIRHGKP